nr:transposase [Mycolicibacter sinensis]
MRKARALTGPDAWEIDDTGFVKDGHSSPCVARQYSGDRRVVLLRPHPAGGGRPRRIRSHHRLTRRRRACNIAPRRAWTPGDPALPRTAPVVWGANTASYANSNAH